MGHHAQRLIGQGLCKSIAIGLILGLGAEMSPAQIVPDGTLGTGASRLEKSPTGNIDITVIEGGLVRGPNLFHSFEAFGVEGGQAVYFANPVGIEQIFSRVTGNSVSRIDGTLGVLGSADLFLLNPNGIVFGPGARLDVAGSFLASTAESLAFGPDLEFSAVALDSPPLLNVNIKPGLQMGRQNSVIEIRGQLLSGQDLTLVSDSLDLQGRLSAGRDLTLLGNSVQIRDGVGSALVAIANRKLLIQGNDSVDIFALNDPASRLFSGGEMVLRSSNPVIGDAHFFSGGTFQVENLLGKPGDLLSPNDPFVRAAGDVVFGNYEGVSLHVLAGGSVTAGDITITGADALGNALQETVTLSDGVTPVAIDGINHPVLDIRSGTMATQPVSLTELGFSPAPVSFSSIPTDAGITLNRVQVKSPDGLVFLSNQYEVNSTLVPGDISVSEIYTDQDTGNFTGNAGQVVIDSRGDIALAKEVNTSANGVGNAGMVSLFGTSIILDKTRINTQSDTQGDSGEIRFKANEIYLFNGAKILSTRLKNGAGKAGDIVFVANSLEMRDNSTINTDSNATGNAGDLTLLVKDIFLSDKSELLTRLYGTGRAGDILIVGDAVRLQNSSVIFADTGGNGDAGDITFQLTGDMLMDNISRVANTGSNQGGRPGSITFNANALTIRNSFVTSRINTKGSNDGIFVYLRENLSIDRGGLFTDARENVNAPGANSGDIRVRAKNIFLDNGGRIQAGSIGLAGGGEIFLDVEDTLRAERSAWILNNAGAGSLGSPKKLEVRARQIEMIQGQISSSTQSSANGGEILLNAETINLRENSQVRTNTSESGNAGNITINAANLLSVIEDSLIFSSVNNGSGNGGDIQIKTPQLTLASGGRVEATTEGIALEPLANELEGLSYAQIVEADNPIAYWKLDDINSTIALDSSGNGVDGTYVGIVNQLIPGVDGTAAKFGITDGKANGTIQIDDSLDLRNTSFIIETWIKPDLDNPPKEQVFFGAHDESTTRNSLHLRLNSNGSVRLGLWGDDLDTPVGVLPFDGQWHHVVAKVIYSRPPFIYRNTTRLEIDGVEAAVGTKGPFEGEPPVAVIGAWEHPLYPQPFKGDIDEVAIYKIPVGPESPDPESDVRLFERHYVAGLLSQGLSSEEIALVSGEARAGNIKIEAEVVNISGVSEKPNERIAFNSALRGVSSGLFSGSERSSSGPGGNIQLKSKILNISDAGALSSTTVSRSNAGNIDVQTEKLSLTNGGQILTSSRGMGNAGKVRLESQSIDLSGMDEQFEQRVLNAGENRVDVDGPLSGIFARATSSGAAGEITVRTTDQLRVKDRAQIAVNATAQGDAGNIVVNSPRIVLDTEGSLSAQTLSSNGGDINLTSDILVLRRGGNVETDAGGSGNGGNIDINTAFLIGLPGENSDIIANAIGGDGGRINITAQTIFNFEQKDGQNRDQLRANRTNDISASSETGTSGTIVLNTPDLDPSRGLFMLPNSLVDPSDRIDRSCAPNSEASRSSFVITGRGGIPLSPDEAFGSPMLINPWIPLPQVSQPGAGLTQSPTVQAQDLSPHKPLIEAQTWIVTPSGQIQLIAEKKSRPLAFSVPCASRGRLANE